MTELQIEGSFRIVGAHVEAALHGPSRNTSTRTSVKVGRHVLAPSHASFDACEPHARVGVKVVDMAFAVVLLGHSFPVPEPNFQRKGPQHWLLRLADVLPNMKHEHVQQAAFFLTAPMDMAAGLGLYVSVDGAQFELRGCVCSSKPSTLVELRWPDKTQQDLPWEVEIGISMEPLVELEAKLAALKVSRKESFAKRVALDLFRYLESYNVGTRSGDNLVVPANCLDRWYLKLEDKLRRDPTYLERTSPD